MLTLGNGWTKWAACLTLMLLLHGCTSVPRNSICDGTIQSRTNHAASLVADGGSQSLVTGALLIQQIDAGCGE
jgi:hypothetical protein